MMQMTRHINKDWKAHVAVTGVTCYTCHRGMPVPANIWFDNPGPPHAAGFSATNDGMGHPARVNGSTALPVNALQNTLEGNHDDPGRGDASPACGIRGVNTDDGTDLFADDSHVREFWASTARSATIRGRSRNGRKARRSA